MSQETNNTTGNDKNQQPPQNFTTPPPLNKSDYNPSNTQINNTQNSLGDNNVANQNHQYNNQPSNTANYAAQQGGYNPSNTQINNTQNSFGGYKEFGNQNHQYSNQPNNTANYATPQGGYNPSNTPANNTQNSLGDNNIANQNHQYSNQPSNTANYAAPQGGYNPSNTQLNNTQNSLGDNNVANQNHQYSNQPNNTANYAAPQGGYNPSNTQANNTQNSLGDNNVANQNHQYSNQPNNTANYAAPQGGYNPSNTQINNTQNSLGGYKEFANQNHQYNNQLSNTANYAAPQGGYNPSNTQINNTQNSFGGYKEFGNQNHQYNNQPNNMTNYAVPQGVYNPYTQYNNNFNKQMYPDYYAKKDLRRHGNYFGLSYLLVTIVSTISILAYVFIVTYILTAVGVQITDDSAYLNVYLLNVIATIPGFLLVFYIIAKLMKYKISDLLPFEKVSMSDSIACIMVCMSVGTLGVLQSGLVQRIFEIFSLSPSTLEVTASNNSLFENFILIFAISVAPALLEEFAYRGVVYGSLSKFNKHFAVFMSALLFGFMHGNLPQAIFAFAMGLALGYSLLLTKNFFIPILVHFLNNFIAIMSEILYNYLLKLDIKNLTDLADFRISIFLIIYRLTFFIGAVFAIKYLFKKYKNIGKSEEKSLLSAKESCKIFCETPGMVIFFVVIGIVLTLTVALT